MIRNARMLCIGVLAALLFTTPGFAKPGLKTKTRVEGSARTTVFGEPVTFTARVTPSGSAGEGTPTGVVTFTDPSGDLLGTATVDASGTATLTINSLAAGDHKVTAAFHGSGGYEDSDDTTIHRVDPLPTSAALSGPPSSVFGEPVTFTATVSVNPSSTVVPTGTVTFFIDGVPAGSATLGAGGQAAIAVSSMSVGRHLVSGTYTSGTPNILPSAAPAIELTVRAASTTVELSSGANPSAIGDPVTFTAVVTAEPSAVVPTGTVTFTVDTVVAGSATLNSGGQASITLSGLAVGRHTVVAQYTSDSTNFVSNASAPLVQEVQRGYIVAGAESGSSQVVVFEARTGAEVTTFLAFGGFTGGVTVAAGDVNNDGFADIIVGAGPGGNTHVKVFDGATFGEMQSFFAFSGVSGGVTVAAGDVNGDGYADIIAGAPVNGHVKAFDGRTGGLIASFLAFGGAFPGSVTVAAGDVNGDGADDIIVGASINAHVKVFDGITLGERYSFLAYPGFAGSVYVAAGDVNGDGTDDIITGAGSDASHVKVFDGSSLALRASFLAYGSAPYGVRVGSVDRNGDGADEIITTVAGPSSHVQIFDGATLAVLDSFLALSPSAGVFIGGSR